VSNLASLNRSTKKGKIIKNIKHACFDLIDLPELGIVKSACNLLTRNFHHEYSMF